MSRVKRGNVARKRRKKILKLAKGFRGSHSKTHQLKKAEVGLNRKMLAQLAMVDPQAFAKVVEVAKSAN